MKRILFVLACLALAGGAAAIAGQASLQPDREDRRGADGRQLATIGADHGTNPLSSAQAPEVTGLAWCGAAKDCLMWDAVVPAPVEYRLYRGSHRTFSALLWSAPDSCLELWTTATSSGWHPLNETPDACGVYWFLVTAVDESGEGPAGNATGRPRVLNSTGNCAQGCVPAGGSCAVTDECCGGRCVSGACAPACCAREGELCASDAECCNGACCDGLCVDPATNAGNCGGCGFACSTNHVPSPACMAGTCVGPCEAGWGDCDGSKRTNGCETSLSNDPDNCGGCALVCSSNHVISRACTSGICTGACSGGYADCDGNRQTDGCEVDLLSDPAHCGACPNACPPVPNATVTCAGGACAFVCNGQDNDCDGAASNGCETDIATDPLHCGGCGLACSTNHVPVRTCAAGVCTGACAPGWGDCNANKLADGCETNTSGDPDNCGACGLACSTNHVQVRACTGGSCTGACAAGWGNCDGMMQANGCETSLSNDPDNCGACVMICSSNHVPVRTCSAGVCSGSCEAGWGDCDADKVTNGCEIDIASNPDSCGGCGLVCSSNHVISRTCTSGICTGACAAGWGDCDGNKQTNGCETNTTNDPNNCGGCGLPCSTNHVLFPVCTGGNCMGTCTAGWGDCDMNMRTNGCETNLNTDPNNCGYCGRTCGVTRVCVMGQCQ